MNFTVKTIDDVNVDAGTETGSSRFRASMAAGETRQFSVPVNDDTLGAIGFTSVSANVYVYNVYFE